MQDQTPHNRGSGQGDSAYLDHASTSPLRPEALAAMLPFLTEHFGNPSAVNAPGRRARLAVDEARDQVAESLGCSAGEVVFCSGGTEAANLAVLGALAGARRDEPGSRFVCSAVEHPCVLKTVESTSGATVSTGADGIIDLDRLTEILSETPPVAGVAVMLANNEVGTIQPIAEVAQIARRRAPGAVVVVDAVHAAPWLDVASISREVQPEILFVSAHKFGGPKGVGALMVRAGTRWAPTRTGGAQERGRRPGTENVASIVGMAAALTATVGGRPEDCARVAGMRDRLADGLLAALPGVTETAVSGAGSVSTSPPRRTGTAGREKKVPGSCHLLIDGVEQDELLFLLDSDGVYASAGSACASGASEPSHVLHAMGVPDANAPLRLSLGYSTTQAEIDHALKVLPKVVEHLRSFNRKTFS